ncbi:Calreticulin family protein [Histomonas meleagridis]|uniref:Calreticulin family protein n=1 Tax=Histomonas meleagridis TaxID=135588 RepID=UPI00355AC424|nr:Calreticulin family protein [Histomonas meleagridis]KAH0803534.1 Calreticulin family protein [Histomonas meleagridis]
MESKKIPEYPKSGVLFFESFDGRADYHGWETSSLPNYTGQWKVQTPPKPRCDLYERMLFLTTKEKYSAISTIFKNPVEINENPFILQFEMRAVNNITCSGGYIKLFTDPNFNPKTFSNETKHFIMFGPDICVGKNRVAFLFNHQNPKTKTIVEKSLIKPPTTPKDDFNHLFTLIVRPNGRYRILVDNVEKKSGDFIDSFDPPIIPPRSIPDPNKQKPFDWDDREYIEDPSFREPTDDNNNNQPILIPDPDNLSPPKGWLIDEQPYIDDPSISKPPEWDDSILGNWIQPKIPNPKCKRAVGCGEYVTPLVANPNHPKNWYPRYIPNPNYKGKWTPPLIDNPEYFENPKSFAFPPIYALGFELHNADKEIGFNNILIANNEKEVIDWNKKFFASRHNHQLQESKPLQTPTPERKRNEMTDHLSNQKVSVLRASLWQIADSWKDLYNEDKFLTLTLTLSAIILPTLLMCFCARRINRDFSEIYEEEEEEEEEEEKVSD